jgi:hypothetical protein
MSLIFNYSPLPGLEKTGVLAPIVPITFINAGHSFSTFALVDSGAENAVISTVVADALSINWRNIKKEMGFGMGGKNFVFHRFKDLEAEIEYNNFVMDICVIEGIYAFKCVLGRNDIFKKAEIRFKGFENKFELIFRNTN